MGKKKSSAIMDRVELGATTLGDCVADSTKTGLVPGSISTPGYTPKRNEWICPPEICTRD